MIDLWDPPAEPYGIPPFEPLVGDTLPTLDSIGEVHPLQWESLGLAYEGRKSETPLNMTWMGDLRWLYDETTWTSDGHDGCDVMKNGRRVGFVKRVTDHISEVQRWPSTSG